MHTTVHYFSCYSPTYAGLIDIGWRVGVVCDLKKSLIYVILEHLGYIGMDTAVIEEGLTKALCS